MDVHEHHRTGRESVSLTVSRLRDGFHQTFGDFPKPKQIHRRQHGRNCKQEVEAQGEHFLHLKRENTTKQSQ